jgi:hypothetical protein
MLGNLTPVPASHLPMTNLNTINLRIWTGGVQITSTFLPNLFPG